MSSHAKRLARLEALAPTPPCPLCATRPVFTIAQPGDPPPAPCASCGRVPERFTLTIGPYREEQTR